MWLLLKLLVCLSLSHTQSELLPPDILQKIEHNILSFRLAKEGGVNVNEFDHFEVNDPQLSKFFLGPDEMLLLNVSKFPQLTFPDTSFKLFIIENPYRSKTIGDTTIKMTTSPHGNNNHLDQFLVAYSHLANEVKYLGGEFYKSMISSDFDFKKGSIIQLLKLKYFNYKLRDIKYLKKKKGHFLFQGYSESIKRDITFLVDKKFRDNITLVFE